MIPWIIVVCITTFACIGPVTVELQTSILNVAVWRISPWSMPVIRWWYSWCIWEAQILCSGFTLRGCCYEVTYDCIGSVNKDITWNQGTYERRFGCCSGGLITLVSTGYLPRSKARFSPPARVRVLAPARVMTGGPGCMRANPAKVLGAWVIRLAEWPAALSIRLFWIYSAVI